VTEEEVNAVLEQAANTDMKGILGVEHRPLVSVDYVNDDRSSIVDALSTMVVDGTLLKLFLWSAYERAMKHMLNYTAIFRHRTSIFCSQHNTSSNISAPSPLRAYSFTFILISRPFILLIIPPPCSQKVHHRLHVSSGMTMNGVTWRV
jgi:hypothetical protein